MECGPIAIPHTGSRLAALRASALVLLSSGKRASTNSRSGLANPSFLSKVCSAFWREWLENGVSEAVECGTLSLLQESYVLAEVK